MPRPNWTEADVAKLMKRRDTDVVETVRRVIPGPRYRSKLEGAFAAKLELERRTGLLSFVAYEPLSFILPGERNRYKPDFLVAVADADEMGGLTFLEVKGWSRSNDRSLVKLKTAAGLHPWARFVLVTYHKGEWVERVIR